MDRTKDQKGAGVKSVTEVDQPHALLRGVPLRVQLHLTQATPSAAVRPKEKKKAKSPRPSLPLPVEATPQVPTVGPSLPTKKSMKLKVFYRAPGPEGASKRSSKRKCQCTYCEHWFSVKEMRTHFKICRDMALNPAMYELCRGCKKYFPAQEMADHLAQSHPGVGAWQVRGQVEKTEPEEPPKEKRIRCRLCELMIREESMQHHTEAFHTHREEWRPHGNARRFSFILLPPSKEGLRSAIEHYIKLPRSHPHSLMDVHFDWSRLERIESLGPIARYVGTKVWKGYVVFEFAQTDKVVLECPQTGNATYILQGNWREMIAASKAELRSEYRQFCTRIIHGRDWERRVRRTVFDSNGRAQKGVVVKLSAVSDSQVLARDRRP